MPSPIFPGDPPQHLITEPLLCSFKPKKLEDGSIRMAFIKAGQKAYSIFGDEATLTEEFISRDYKTWEGGLVSINHQYNNEWVKAIMRDIEYDPKEKIGICSFYEIPDWLTSLIYSDDYRGLSQECIPIEFGKNSTDVIKGYGTGVTIVTDPYEPAANQTTGVGIRPELAAILASKYPTQIGDTMVESKGGGTPAISVEAFESSVSENVQLKSTIKALESEKKTLETELDSTRKEFSDYKSGEADRIKTEVEKALRAYDAEVKAGEERAEAIRRLESAVGNEKAKKFLSTNPTIEIINSFVEIKEEEIAEQNAKLAREVGSFSSEPVGGNEDVTKLVSELRGTRTVVKK